MLAFEGYQNAIYTAQRYITFGILATERLEVYQGHRQYQPLCLMVIKQ
jgi:hypothetical protein